MIFPTLHASEHNSHHGLGCLSSGSYFQHIQCINGGSIYFKIVLAPCCSRNHGTEPSTFLLVTLPTIFPFIMSGNRQSCITMCLMMHKAVQS